MSKRNKKKSNIFSNGYKKPTKKRPKKAHVIKHGNTAVFKRDTYN